MPEKIDYPNALTTEGNFNTDFLTQIATLAGEDHKGTKVFDDTPSLPSLVKAYADTKSLVGKKQENVIQKPASDASDEQKAEYQAQLLTALGAPEKAEDYALTTKPENWPEGLPFDERLMKDYQDYFLEKKYPVGMAQELVAKYHEILLQRVSEQIAEEDKIFSEQVDARKAEWKGDALTKKTRTAAKAMLQFSSAKRIEEIQKAKLLDAPTDFGIWRNLFVVPDQVVVWANIGEAMRSDEHTGNEVPAVVDTGSDRKKSLSKVYTHPTSQELLKTVE